MAQTRTIIRQKSQTSIIGEIGICLAGSIFLALMSQVAFPLPFTPIPFSLQTLAVFLLGGVLGSKRAGFSVLAYLVQGSCGLPVFAGGLANPLWLLDVKAGFIASFLVAAFMIGKLLEKNPRENLFYLLGTLCLGQTVIFALGMGWLSFYSGLEKAFVFGVVPFLSGAMVKIGAAASILKGYQLMRDR
jgi:biotin transport system substrate-specific component